MPFTLTWNDDGTYVKFFGKVSISEVREADDLHYGNKKFDDIKYQICDYSDADVSHIMSRDAKIQAAHDKAASHYKTNLKVANIGKGEHIETFFEEYADFMRQWQSKWEVRSFSNYKEAIQWCTNEALT